MALADFLYRCPFCGADPMSHEGNTEARCRGCGRDYRLARSGSEIVVRTHEGEARATPSELRRALEALGGAIPGAEKAEGELHREAKVRIRLARNEEPVRYQGRLLGFFERFEPFREGRLRLDGAALSFLPGPEGGEPLQWPLDEIRALQSSSSSLQISPAEGGVVLFRFPRDSSRRWEELVAEALRRRWRSIGRGEIVEFQPRIRSGAGPR